jgi:hypothetical protein
MNGGGFIQASNLHTDVLRVTVNGGTRVRLTATINGAGRVNYVGSPRVEGSIDGLGIVRPRS